MAQFDSWAKWELRRRDLLRAGWTAVGLAGLGGTWLQFQRQRSLAIRVPPLPEAPVPDRLASPMRVLRDFDYGTLKRENGRTVREFEIVADTAPLQLTPSVSFVTWNYNGRIPGPTLRAKAGDRVRVIFRNEGGHSHSMHFHGVHPAEADGVEPVRHGETTVYEFDAEPFGVHLYHCHIAPVTRHISKGLYGLFIIDPPQPRPPADEMVLVMAGYDLDDDQRNDLYAFNGVPHYYHHHPIAVYQHQRIRLYVLNMIEFDAAVSFHLHANFFQVYPTGRTLTPSQETDILTLGTAERHILEFSFPFTGKYMFHPHQDAIAEAGCMGMFDVHPAKAKV